LASPSGDLFTRPNVLYSPVCACEVENLALKLVMGSLEGFSVMLRDFSDLLLILVFCVSPLWFVLLLTVSGLQLIHVVMGQWAAVLTPRRERIMRKLSFFLMLDLNLITPICQTAINPWGGDHSGVVPNVKNN
jgi:hypothetical protein